MIDGSLRCIPTSFGRKGDSIFLHGSVKSPLLTALGNGAEACVTVTEVNGIVLARSLFHSSMNYRSVMLIGNGELIVEKGEKMEALRVLSDSIWKGRWEEARKPTDGELSATAVVRIPLREGSAKIRTGPPIDNKEDYDLQIWAGIIPVETRYGDPQPDEQLGTEIDVPASVKRKIS